LTGALHVLQLQLSPLTTFIILNCSKIQNGDVLVPAYLSFPEKWPLNECFCCFSVTRWHFCFPRRFFTYCLLLYSMCVCVIMLSTQQMVFCMNKLCGWQTSTLTADELAQQLVQLLRLHILSTRHTSQPLGMSASNLPVMTQTLTFCYPPVGAHGRIYDSNTISVSCIRMQIMPVLTDLFAFPLVITVSRPSLQS